MGGMAAALDRAIVYLLLLGTFLYAVAFVGNPACADDHRRRHGRAARRPPC